MMSSHRHDTHLTIPASALRDRSSVEMLRVWFNEDGPHCSVRAGVWEEHFGVNEPTGWATLIADHLRELANGIAPGDPGLSIVAVGRALIPDLDSEIADASAYPRIVAPPPSGVAGKRKPPLELPIPPAVRRDHDAFEMIRVWVSVGDRHGSAKLGGFRSIPLLARIFSKVTRQIAEALHSSRGRDVGDTLRTMRSVILSELGVSEVQQPTPTRREADGSSAPIVHLGDTPMACTPLKALIEAIRSNEPQSHHSSVWFYRAWAEAIASGIAVEDGPDEELSVTWLDGELHIALPVLTRYLRSQEVSAGDRSAWESREDLLVVLSNLGSMAEHNLA
ncbi:DUF5076 domain-containing protein [Tautonia plasticadhaerens]|uniref:Uncharacterized protein n=1 Tax=Tautonia plasticadhaerens TaxID=2527974 RepID=A0A518HEF3_9BACT|nr:DUF5076 domain-containing protein [Tautonia plasticadhaerens]QDV39225.1 hypothetical protein ElP_71890 [Tautonia plasticadhaerens]